MTDPLRFSLDVACPVDHAFGVWTDRINLWWPADHTVSGRSDSEVVLEARLGGRILTTLLPHFQAAARLG